MVVEGRSVGREGKMLNRCSSSSWPQTKFFPGSLSALIITSVAFEILKKQEYNHISFLYWVSSFMYTDDYKYIFSNLYFQRKNITFSPAIWKAVLCSILQWITIKSRNIKTYLLLMFPWTMVLHSECLTFMYL